MPVVRVGLGGAGWRKWAILFSKGLLSRHTTGKLWKIIAASNIKEASSQPNSLWLLKADLLFDAHARLLRAAEETLVKKDRLVTIFS